MLHPPRRARTPLLWLAFLVLLAALPSAPSGALAGKPSKTASALRISLRVLRGATKGSVWLTKKAIKGGVRHPRLAAAVLALWALSDVPPNLIYSRDPPTNKTNACEIVKQRPGWYRTAKLVQEVLNTRGGDVAKGTQHDITVATIFAIAQAESNFDSGARPGSFGIGNFRLHWKNASLGIGEHHLDFKYPVVLEQSAQGYVQITDGTRADLMKWVGPVRGFFSWGLSLDRDDFGNGAWAIGWRVRQAKELYGFDAAGDPGKTYDLWYGGPNAAKAGRRAPPVPRNKVIGRGREYERQLRACDAFDDPLWHLRATLAPDK